MNDNNEIPVEEETWLAWMGFEMVDVYTKFDFVKKSFLQIMKNWSDIIFYTGNVEVNIFWLTIVLAMLIAGLRYLVAKTWKIHGQIAGVDIAKEILKEDKGTVTDAQSSNRDASSQDQGDFSKASTINCSFCGNPVILESTVTSNIYKLRPRV